MNNTIMYLTIERDGPLWKFTDPSRDLYDEPFVGGVPEIFNALVEPDRNTAYLVFSSNGFPGSLSADLLSREHDGAWYQVKESGQKGWLCPALLKYYPDPPKTLHFQFQ